MQTTGILSEQGQPRNILRVQWCSRCIIALCALIDCWINRFQMNPDGVSYLDMGDLYWKANWHAALNVLWSPLYSWLTGLMFLLTKPAMRWEYPEVHLLTFAILVATLFCFEFFWRELLSSLVNKTWVGPLLPHAWVLGYLLFAYVHLGVHRLLLVTPDLLVDALIYLASGMMLRFVRGRLGAASAVLLGVILGTGYLAKAAMLPFAAVLMMTMVAVAWKQHRSNSLVVATLLGFLLTALPFIAALSWNMHRFTWGDSAKLNQGWCVNHASPPYRNWQGDRPDHSDAVHPTRKLMNRPEVYEFAAPVAGTYPVWYDPGYWCAGIDPALHWTREIRAILRNSLIITEHALLESGFLAAVALIFIIGGSVRDSWRNLLAFWPICIPAAAVFVMYAMVHWEARFTTGMMLVLWGAAIVATKIATEKRKTTVFWSACLLLGALAAGRFSFVLIEDYRASGRAEQTVMVAERLLAVGIEPGEPIAVIGDGTIASYWARLGKYKIIAEVPGSMETIDSTTVFWKSGSQGEITVLNLLKSLGAKAVVADIAPAALPPGWLPLGNTGRAVYLFQ